MTATPTVEVLGAADADVRQRRAAGSLLAAGLGAGDRVAFCLPSSADLLCAVLGALRVGIVPVLLNATLTSSERDVLVDDARPQLVVTDADGLGRLGTGHEAALAPVPLARPMHYTSGTTGRAKGVWSGVWDRPTADAALADEADQWGFGPDDVHLVCSPMYHSVSVRFAGGTLLAGGTCVVLGQFDAGAAADALAGAGAVTGMELDINPEWVQLAWAAAPGGPLSPGVPGQNRPGNQYQIGWSRDFVTVLAAG